MDINYYKQFEPIDGKWYITRELGNGAFGNVFEIERRDFSHAKSALKVITIPSSQSEVQSYCDENFDSDEKSVTSYFYGFVEEFVSEFKLMTKLRGNSNIVSIEDYDVKKHEEGIGWDIFIRMELLTPMNKYFKENKLNQRSVIKLGIDICKALEVCQKYKIIHRDIKPSNIFVSDTGDFKLGDFGVARTLEKTSSGLSKKGTNTYMAPEVFKGDEYGSNVDIYSLGIVMYRLLNNNFEPFRTERTHSNEENALTRRLKGELIPAPVNADGRLAEIILKACSFNPKERYESPLQMRQELESILYSESDTTAIYPGGDELDYDPTNSGNNDNDKTEGIFDNKDTAEETQGVFDTVENVAQIDDKYEFEEVSNESLTKDNTEPEKETGGISFKAVGIVTGIILLIAFLGILGNVNRKTTIIDANVTLENFDVGVPLLNLELISDSPEMYSAEIIKCCYYDDSLGEEVEMQATDIFEQDIEYKIQFNYIPAKGYKFVDYIDFKVNKVGVPRVEGDDPVGPCRLYSGYAEYIPYSSFYDDTWVSLGNWEVPYQKYDSPVKNCKAFDLHFYTYETTSGDPSGEWIVYLRNTDGVWNETGRFNHKDGENTSITIESATVLQTFDAIALVRDSSKPSDHMFKYTTTDFIFGEN